MTTTDSMEKPDIIMCMHYYIKDLSILSKSIDKERLIQHTKIMFMQNFVSHNIMTLMFSHAQSYTRNKVKYVENVRFYFKSLTL